MGVNSARKKVTAGAIVIAGIGIAFLLRGIGLQIGTSDESGVPSNSLSTTNNDLGIAGEIMPTIPEPKSPEETQKDPVVKPLQSETVPMPDTSRMVTIIIEEKHYLLGTNATPPKIVKRIELVDALDKAKLATGTEKGVRCRIFYLGSSLPSAETELNEKLKNLGLKQSEIDIEDHVLVP